MSDIEQAEGTFSLMIMPPCKSRQGPPDILSKYVKGAESPTYYIAGPPAMVQGLHAMLNKAGVANGHIRAEEFAGY